jgi:hypothetical protein
MKRQLILIALLLAGTAGVSQAAPASDGVMNAPLNPTAAQAGHLLKVARVFLGYDQFGRPVYGYRHLPRVIVGYDRFGRPIYGRIFNNRPLFLHPRDYGVIVRPYRHDWDWGHRRWERRYEHRGDRFGERDFRRHEEYRRHDEDRR